MHRTIDFNQDRDFPTDKNLYIWSQNLVEELMQAIVASGQQDTNYVILSGVEEDGGTYSDGWVVILGELLPFTGGSTQSTVIIVEDITQASWRATGGSIVARDTYFERHVEFGTGAGQINFNLFKRLEFARAKQSISGSYGYLGNTDNPLETDFVASATGTIVHRDQFQRVHIQGIFQYIGSSPTLPELVATIHTDLRPSIPVGAAAIYSTLIDITDGSTLIVSVTKSNGKLEVIYGTLQEDHYYFIDINYIKE